MADAPALDLRWRPGADAITLCEILYAALDGFAPLAIHEHETADGWRVFFRTDELRDRAAESLRSSFAASLTEISSVQVPDEGWARRSQAGLRAVRVGRIVVAPPWDDTALSATHATGNEAARRSLIVVIDPSTGFGTGHHETTRLCLALLQEVDVAGHRAIDVGTGSGVLAIAAAKLGASSVLALDDDPEALRNAAENVTRNDVSGVVVLQTADLASFHSPPASIVTANLTGAALERHADRLRALVSAGGALIVSGFNGGEADDVAAAFGDRVERRIAEGDWAAMLLRLTGSPARS